MSLLLERMLQRTLVSGGAVINVTLEWEDKNALSADQYHKFEDAYLAASRAVILTADRNRVAQLWMEDLRQKADSWNGVKTPEINPLDFFNPQIYAFLETHGIDPGDKYAIVVLDAVSMDKTFEVHGPGVEHSPITTLELAVVAARYQDDLVANSGKS